METRAMTPAALLASVAAIAALAWTVPAAAQVSPDLKAQCSSCHALEKPATPSVARLWSRKGPDLWYAGDKFNQPWLVKWLQKPTPIRPGGVMWFNLAKPGEPRDTLDTSQLKPHPAVDAATAAKLADGLMKLKSGGLVVPGAYKTDAPPNMTMAKMAFGKLRGCAACHSYVPGQGGLSGPAFHDADARLQPDFVYAYAKDPQAFDRYVWMPKASLTDQDLQRLTAYIVSNKK
jgi:cytochrome c2